MPESVDARHILVKTKAEAEKVRALLEADNTDANWKKVAKQYSTDPGSKNNGGSLGNFPKGRMVKPFENAAFALKVGEISQPVKTQFGYHVIEVTKKTPGNKQTLRAGQGDDRAAAQVPEAGHGLGGLAQAGHEGRRRRVRRRLRPGDAHRVAEPRRLGAPAAAVRLVAAP